jgi:uncharacterized Zn-finger protein
LRLFDNGAPLCRGSLGQWISGNPALIELWCRRSSTLHLIDAHLIDTMTDQIVPHFHNDAGVAVIEIGAKEFMCVGAVPPFDHPHVFCDMGDDVEFVCPYCSTLYRYDPTLAPAAARPPECALVDGPASHTPL